MRGAGDSKTSRDEFHQGNLGTQQLQPEDEWGQRRVDQRERGERARKMSKKTVLCRSSHLRAECKEDEEESWHRRAEGRVNT
jgi:hypothetical protein